MNYSKKNMVLMVIKEVNPRDLKKIVYLEHQIFKEDAFSKDLMEKFIAKNFLFLKLEISKLKKHLIGFIIAIKDQKEMVNIVNLLINPKFQNRGYGSYLLQQTIEKIKQLKNINKIVLNVQISNLIAIKLYEKFNFKKNPIVCENYYQSGEGAYLMELDIYS